MVLAVFGSVGFASGVWVGILFISVGLFFFVLVPGSKKKCNVCLFVKQFELLLSIEIQSEIVLWTGESALD
jgi:hypothetical protein